MATPITRSVIITPLLFGTDDDDDSFYSSAIHAGKRHAVEMPGFKNFSIVIASHRKIIDIK